MATRNALAIDVTRRRVRVVQTGRASHGGLKVQRMLVCDVPSELSIDDPTAVGNWLGQQLLESGFQRSPVTMSVGREHVIVKRITLPTVDAAELPDMTRLAMHRESTFEADNVIIDFVPVERHDTSTTVLAVAVPRKQIEYLSSIAEAGGLKVRRMALRTMGAVALANSSVSAESESVRVEDVGRMTDDEPDAGMASTSAPAVAEPLVAAQAKLAIDVVGEGVEFVVLREGSIRFSRAAEVPSPQDELAMAEAVVTEARRTWMSYRSVDEVGAIGEAVIMGDRRVAEYAAGPVGHMLGLPVQVLCEHPRVDVNGHDVSRVWPLIGLLLEEQVVSERLDFLAPRKAPDVQAQRRLRRLLVAAAFVVIGGAAITFMRQDLAGLRTELAMLSAKTKAGDAEYARYYRDSFRVQHLHEWEKVNVNWLEHAMFLAQVAPPPDQIVLDSWSGTLEAGEVTYDRERHRWRTDPQATIVIEGEARNRATADAFRGALIQDTAYVASTAGADTRGGKRMPFGFTYRLRTHSADPPPSVERALDKAASPAEVESSSADSAARQPDAAPNAGEAVAAVAIEQRGVEERTTEPQQ